MTFYKVIPVPAPRMTRSDKWKKRPIVMAYFAYRDRLKELQIDLPIPYKLTFHMPMPKSWSKKMRAQMIGRPHAQRPDKDNLEKAVLDALFENDSHIWSGWVEKRWAEEGGITVEAL